MAKKNMIEREKKRIALSNKYESVRRDLRAKLKNAEDIDEKFAVSAKLEKLPRNSLKVRVNNRCWVTGRSRSYYRAFGLSRHVLREMAHDGLLPGVKKASW
jgi:small subunit ribosomal protein S14